MYNFSQEVVYDNNDEYRKCIQIVFNMENIESEDSSEVLFDNLAMKNGIEFLFETTKTNELFIDLYENGE